MIDEPIATSREVSPDDSATERPPETVRWLGDESGDGVADRGVLEIELPHALIEWLALEADESEHVDTIAEWAKRRLWFALQEDLREEHSDGATITYEVPEEAAVRARLNAEARAAHDDSVDVDTATEVALVNELNLNAELQVHEPDPC